MPVVEYAGTSQRDWEEAGRLLGAGDVACNIGILDGRWVTWDYGGSRGRGLDIFFDHPPVSALAGMGH